MSKDVASMSPLCEDLRAECRELDTLLAVLSDEPGWALRTRFHGWSAWDEVAHLHLFDRLALIAIKDRDEFLRERREIETALASGKEISGIARERLAHLPGASIAAPWRETWEAMIYALGTLDPKARLPWFGPDMSARSFTTARLMETWAHGQDVWDALDRVRPTNARLGHIAQLGVLTFGWSFINRGLTPPATPPIVELETPDESIWSWNRQEIHHSSMTDTAAVSSVRGTALDFCLVVTQRRHVADTSLTVQGEVAKQWMSIAQCFAGPPATGPAAGSFKRQGRPESE